GMTDCLNFGNPEVPKAFDDFVQSVKGIADAASKICWKGDGKSPVPFVSGNVSFYNESATGKQVDPSPIIACMGYMEDYTKAITMKLKDSGSTIFSIGCRHDELGGSVYYDINNEVGANVPNIDFEKEKKRIYAIIDCIDNELFLSCHDISDGGILTTISEMALGGEADGKIGAELNLDSSELSNAKTLFSESPGFIFEVKEKNISSVKEIFDKYELNLREIGKTTSSSSLSITKDDKKIIDLKIDELKKAWTSGIVEAME
ncbi:MAG: AIR synthase-related protein, partial [Nanoarchaeota archaeon]|nr:AIR synthase-related protein [Nanoarchaeota archaeon]